MPVVTISRMYGSGGSEVAAGLASRLQWALLDNAFVERVAVGLHLTPAHVEAIEERRPSLAERIADAFAYSSQEMLSAPLGALSDTGGEVEAWLARRGFERAGIDAIGALADPAPTDFAVYQSPGPAYGLIPRFATPMPSAGFLIAGVSVLLFGADNQLDL